ncbi:endonuclease III domain-containing protein [Tautonia plasticadhaerens]|uniref:Endonuclease III n=1 Tax=Tautonia plasticadhaerens TaxID=2527974 RepID=A0A518HB22_9BACT|nr:endonuclease [Tautonia plasticadhaerens]QDV38065.1 Endonuclease III [Tautonia plasticadhaerens]
MAAPSKSQILDKIHPLLAKRYKLGPREAKLSVLEAVLYGICHEGTTREQANQAINRFKDAFFDWNELRVSSVEEIQDALAGLPDPGVKAQRLRRFLRQLFFRTYKFELDHLGKKPLKESIKALQEFEAMNSDFVLATVVQQALGGHAMPVDEPIRRCLVRLGFADEATPPEAIRSALERAVPKAKGLEFVDLLEELAHDTCVAGEPDCPECVLLKQCPTGQARGASKAKPSAAAGAPAEADADPAPTSRRRSGPQGQGEAKPSRGRPPRPK